MILETECNSVLSSGFVCAHHGPRRRGPEGQEKDFQAQNGESTWENAENEEREVCETSPEDKIAEGMGGRKEDYENEGGQGDGNGAS